MQEVITIKNENKIYCPECGEEELIFDFRNQGYNYWICKKCSTKFRTKKEDKE